MRYPVYQAAADHHTQLSAEAELIRLRRVQGVVLELRLPVSQRRGLRIMLLRLLFWPNRLEISV